MWWRSVFPEQRAVWRANNSGPNIAPRLITVEHDSAYRTSRATATLVAKSHLSGRWPQLSPRSVGADQQRDRSTLSHGSVPSSGPDRNTEGDPMTAVSEDLARYRRAAETKLKSYVDSGQSLPEYLLDRPTLPDLCWTDEPREKSESRPAFIARVAGSK